MVNLKGTSFNFKVFFIDFSFEEETMNGVRHSFDLALKFEVFGDDRWGKAAQLTIYIKLSFEGLVESREFEG